MKKIRMLLVILLCACLLAGAAAAEEEDIDLEDLLDIEITEIEEAVVWTFPVALEDMNPEYIQLVNNHYQLDESYVPDDLVKLIKDPDSGPSKGGVRWDGSQSDG